MNGLRRASAVAGTWFAAIVVVFGVVGYLAAEPLAPYAAYIPWLLAVIMLGMGVTLKPGDFAVIARRPWALLLGVGAQFVIMPLVGLGIAYGLGLSAALAAGVVLVGSAPGGTASNVIVYLSRGDTALSVGMTTVSTLLAPILTPLLVAALAGQFLPVDAGALFVSILQIVLVPVLLGIGLRMAFPRQVAAALDVLPLVSVAGIAVTVMVVVAASADVLLSVGLLVVLAVVAHNGFGLLLGYGVAKACRLDVSGRRAVSVEVGMQNSGLAAALAAAHFSPVAALPAALFSLWHNVSGSLLASRWSRTGRDRVPADA